MRKTACYKGGAECKRVTKVDDMLKTAERLRL